MPFEVLVQDTGNFLEAMNRLYNLNEGFLFKNSEESMNLMLRCDPDETSTMRFEVVIDYEEDDSGKFLDLLNRELVEIDGDEHVLGHFTIDKKSTLEDDDVKDAMESLNTMYNIRACGCNKYFIRDSHPVCIYCQMTASKSDMTMEQCTICHEVTPKITLRAQPCCRQFIHARCINKWINSDASGEDPRCPICRAPTKLFSQLSL